MTRFARSKGSKASNERVEEEATPWDQMVAGMKLPPKKMAFDVEDIGDEDNFAVGDTNDDSGVDATAKSSDSSDDEGEEEGIKEKSNLDNLPEVKKPAAADVESSSESDDEKKEEAEGKKKKRKRSQNKCLECKEPGHMKRECPTLSEERRKELQDLYSMKIERKGVGVGRKKTKKRQLVESLESNDNDSSAPKKAKPSQPEEDNPKAKKKNKNKSKRQQERQNNRKRPKKEIKDRAGATVQEGEGLFQGFRVKKEDVIRLRKLHDKMSKEKVSSDEMKAVLKKERRKAERVLANSIKNVCYQCRKPGHLLSACPEKDAITKRLSDGKCFKCGSRDHTSRDCQSKAKGADAFKFAKCFVCNQTGHLAKTCPDNPRGLYPKGGGCRFCGSVEHLKSDCPRKSEKDSRSEIRIGRQTDTNNIEDEPQSSGVKKSFAKQAKKVVKF